ncbi:MAG TPA: Ig-like domain-containing protein [Myxococcales bacterium]|nr:Ig-like domain-containing protein [Myxococcales bacterium]
MTLAPFVPLLLAAGPPLHHRPHDNPRRADRRAFVERVEHAADAADAGFCTSDDGECFWWTGSTSTDSSAIPNDGVATAMQVVNYPPDGGCFDCWISDLLDNQYWGQVGFSACGPPYSNFTTFYQVWNTDAGALLVDGETSWATTGLHAFAMTLDAGTTWTYSVDGTVFGAWDMGAAASHQPYAVQTVCEEGDGITAAFDPPLVGMPVTMDVADLGQWAPAGTAWSYDTTGFVGVAGNDQESALVDDQTAVGGSTPYLAPDAVLWNGATRDLPEDAGSPPLTPPQVEILSPAPNATVSGTVTISAAITTPPGLTLSEVDFWADDPATPNCTLSAPPWVCAWDTSADTPGLYAVYVYANDSAGQWSWMDIAVTVVPSATSGGSSGGAGSSGGTVTGGQGGSSGSGTSGGSTGGTLGGSASGGVTSGGQESSGGSTGGQASGGHVTTGGSGTGASGTGAAGSSGASAASTTGGASVGPGPKPAPAAGCGCSAGTGSPVVTALWLLAVALWRRRPVLAARRRGC